MAFLSCVVPREEQQWAKESHLWDSGAMLVARSKPNNNKKEKEKGRKEKGKQEKRREKKKEKKKADRQTDYIHQSGNRLADATTAAADVDGVLHLKNATRRQSQSTPLSLMSWINPPTGHKFIISDTRLTLWYLFFFPSNHFFD